MAREREAVRVAGHVHIAEKKDDLFAMLGEDNFASSPLPASKRRNPASSKIALTSMRMMGHRRRLERKDMMRPLNLNGCNISMVSLA